MKMQTRLMLAVLAVLATGCTTQLSSVDFSTMSRGQTACWIAEREQVLAARIARVGQIGVLSPLRMEMNELDRIRQEQRFVPGQAEVECMRYLEVDSGLKEPTAAYDEIFDYAAEALFAAAPEEAITYVAAGETLTTAAPNESEAFLAAVLALFIEAPDAYLRFDSAWRNLYVAAPLEFRAIGADEKALYALIEPAEYARAAASGRALLEAAPDEFTAYNNAWTFLRSAAPESFVAMANQQKALYGAAPNRLADADAAGLLAFAAAPNEFIALYRASLFVSVMEALRSAAPAEFAAYIATASGTEAQATAVQSLAAVAPREVVAAAAIEKALQDALETLE